MAPSGATPVTPAGIWGLIGGYSAYWAVAAAAELGVFAVLAEGPKGVPELAQRCDADPDRLLVLLGGVLATGLLEVADGRFHLSPQAAAFLVPGREGAMDTLVVRSPGPHENWTALAGLVRGGDPPISVDDDGAFYAGLVEATFAPQLATARRCAELVADTCAPARVLDLGAGAAPWTIAFLERHEQATAVVNDLAEVLPHAVAHLDRSGVLDRCELLAGDYRALEVASGAFDLVVLGHVCRAEGAVGAPALVARAAAALRPGGSVLIAEYLLDDDRSGPPQALLLGTTMMASTSSGATFTRREARGWLADAGLVAGEVLVPIPPTAVIFGRKEPRP